MKIITLSKCDFTTPPIRVVQVGIYRQAKFLQFYTWKRKLQWKDALQLPAPSTQKIVNGSIILAEKTILNQLQRRSLDLSSHVANLQRESEDLNLQSQ